jgi:hypothetical protein
MHVAMDAGEGLDTDTDTDTDTPERPKGASRASLGAIMGLASAVTATGIATSRPGASDIRAPGLMARPDMSARRPQPDSYGVRRHKELRRLMKERPEAMASEMHYDLGLENRTPAAERWAQRFRKVLYGVPRRRAERP